MSEWSRGKSNTKRQQSIDVIKKTINALCIIVYIGNIDIYADSRPQATRTLSVDNI